MAQPQRGGVLFADCMVNAGSLPQQGDRLWIEAALFEYVYGDSCVLIETGDKGHVSKFWVPTKRIRLREPPQVSELPPELQAEIPSYGPDESLLRYWDIRRRRERWHGDTPLTADGAGCLLPGRSGGNP